MNSDNGIFDSDEPDNSGNEFIKPFEAAMIGYVVGSQLDQTRFGIWFNKNRIVNLTYFLIARLLILFGVFLVVYYIYLLISGWN